MWMDYDTLLSALGERDLCTIQVMEKVATLLREPCNWDYLAVSRLLDGVSASIQFSSVPKLHVLYSLTA
jgi:hypothetical protein